MIQMIFTNGEVTEQKNINVNNIEAYNNFVKNITNKCRMNKIFPQANRVEFISHETKEIKNKISNIFNMNVDGNNVYIYLNLIK